jgi:antitoxin CcdA
MRTPLFDPNARRKTVSITLNQDLAAKAAAAGLNISRLAEEAVARAYTDLEEKRIRAELKDAGERASAYVARYGRPFDDWTSDTGADAGADHAA